MKKLEQHCQLCETVGVNYVKTKGGFWKLCEKCEQMIKDNGLWVQPDIIITS